jgi:hypothetical protein
MAELGLKKSIFSGPVMKSTTAFLLMALGLLPEPAIASIYPVSGKWAYDNASATGAATSCGGRYMEFRGAQRFDTEGGVSKLRNVSVTGATPTWRVVDEFFNVMIRGRVSYILRLADEDHIELRYLQGGERILLRRCGH